MPKARWKKNRTLEIKIPAEYVEPILAITRRLGTWQRPFHYMHRSLKKVDDDWMARVRESHIRDMKEFSQNPEAGTYHSWSVGILKLNEMSPPQADNDPAPAA